ncbi:MAG: UDP-2,3-diacylglucosamine diphosphatase, partial [Bacteroidota bacterium]
KEHIQVIQRILKMAAKGTKVYYITGNHDDALRRYTDFAAGNIHLRDKLELQLKGKSYWIFHGDIFDLFIKYSPFVSRLGGKTYDYLVLANRIINKMRTFFGFNRMSFSKKIKNSVKKAVKFINDFEETALNLAVEKNYDYVICGHIHQPQMRTEEYKGQKVTYLNSGDWIENLTALEYKWGRWSIYEYDEMDYEYINPKLKVNSNIQDEEEDFEGGISVEEVYQQIVQRPSQKN